MKKLITFLLSAVVVFSTVGFNSIPVYGEATDSFEKMSDENSIKVRNAMLERASQVSISFSVNDYPETESERKIWLKEKNAVIFEKVYEHGISPFAGDYLASHVATIHTYMVLSFFNDGSKCSVTYTFTYHDTHTQQNAVEAKINEILASLKIENKSDYEKAKAIYDYICDNVKYQYGSIDTSRYTAYGTLIKGKAVCQGYAAAFYALAMSVGLDSRIMNGTDSGVVQHSWNLVKIDGKNYLLDCTWDASNHQNGLEYGFFLKSQADFTGHDSNEQFKTAEFTSRYPICETSYQAVDSDELTATIPLHDVGFGDVNGDGNVTADDSRLALRKAVGLEVFSAAQITACDVDFDSSISSADARLILRIAVKLEDVQELARQKIN